MAAIAPEIIARITHKKAQYCRLADSNKWEEWEQLFLPDAKFAFLDRDGKPLDWGRELDFKDRAEFVGHFRQAFSVQQTIHLVGPGEFEQLGDDEIKVIWTVIYHAGKLGSTSENHMTGGGHYHETWKRVEGDWFMADLRLENLYLKM